MKNSLVKISSFLYLFSSMLIITFSPTSYIFLTIGLILLAYSFLPEKELAKKKSLLLIIAIVSCFTNIVAAILLFIAISELESEKQVKNNSPPVVSTESKRIDLLLKLGLGMIIISGILFATTSWEIISNIVKVIALIFMSILFISLSVFTEKRLKLKRSANGYFILGLLFVLLTWIGVGHFGVISEWFSYRGEGNHLVYFITFILLSIILYIFAKKFKQKECTYMAHSIVYISTYHLISAFRISLLTAILILTLISLIINLIPKHKKIEKIKQINRIASYLYPIIIFTQCFNSSSLTILLPCLANICNLLIIMSKEKNNSENIFMIIVNYVLIIISVLTSSILLDKTFILFIIISLFSLLIRYNKFNRSNALLVTNQIVFYLVATTLIAYLSTTVSLLHLIASLIFLIVNLISGLNPSKISEEIDFRYRPVVIFIAIAGIYSYGSQYFFFTENLTILSVIALVFMIIKHLAMNKRVEKYYNVLFIVAAIYLYIMNTEFLELVPAITICISAIYLFLTNKKLSNTLKIITYIFVLLAIINLVASIPLLEFAPTLTNLILLIVFIILSSITQDEKLKIVNYIAIAVPLYGLLNSFDVNKNLNLILNNMFYIYLLFLLMKIIVKNKSARDIIGTIGISLIVLDIITIVDLFIGIYIGLLGILIIFITFNEEEYKKMFYCGIVITILNIIIQLWELWSKVPFWLYLLLVGLLIIAFVTYKELNRVDEPKQQTLKEQVLENEKTNSSLLNQNMQSIKNENTILQEKLKKANFCSKCGTENNAGNFCRRCGTDLRIK